MRLVDLRLPVVNLVPFSQHLNGSEVVGAAKMVVDELAEKGVIVVKSPFIDQNDSRIFSRMLQRYFGLPPSVLKRDVRAEVSRQVGFTEPGIEDFSHTQFFREQPEAIALTGDRAPYPHTGPNRHMRFFWRYGPRPAVTQFAELHAEPVIPDGFRDWAQTMNAWASKMYPSGVLLARLIERGLGLPSGAIVDLLHEGAHLLSPTGCDLGKLKIGDVISDIHTDFCPLTGHGGGEFRTLICWTTSGDPFLVNVPPGCLLFQVGVQLEYVTGGRLKAGFHQTVMTEEAMVAVQRAIADGRSTTRASSTFFFEMNSDKMLRVLPDLTYPGCDEHYPPMLAGDHTWKVIQAIGLNSEPRADW